MRPQWHEHSILRFSFINCFFCSNRCDTIWSLVFPFRFRAFYSRRRAYCDATHFRLYTRAPFHIFLFSRRVPLFVPCGPIASHSFIYLMKPKGISWIKLYIVFICGLIPIIVLDIFLQTSIANISYSRGYGWLFVIISKSSIIAPLWSTLSRFSANKDSRSRSRLRTAIKTHTDIMYGWLYV